MFPSAYGLNHVLKMLLTQVASQRWDKLVHWNHLKKILTHSVHYFPGKKTFKTTTTTLSELHFIQFSCYSTFHATFEKLSHFAVSEKTQVFVSSGAELLSLHPYNTLRRSNREHDHKAVKSNTLLHIMKHNRKSCFLIWKVTVIILRWVWYTYSSSLIPSKFHTKNSASVLDAT